MCVGNNPNTPQGVNQQLYTGTMGTNQGRGAMNFRSQEQAPVKALPVEGQTYMVPDALPTQSTPAALPTPSPTPVVIEKTLTTNTDIKGATNDTTGKTDKAPAKQEATNPSKDVPKSGSDTEVIKSWSPKTGLVLTDQRANTPIIEKAFAYNLTGRANNTDAENAKKFNENIYNNLVETYKNSLQELDRIKKMENSRNFNTGTSSKKKIQEINELVDRLNQFEGK